MDHIYFVIERVLTGRGQWTMKMESRGIWGICLHWPCPCVWSGTWQCWRSVWCGQCPPPPHCTPSDSSGSAGQCCQPRGGPSRSLGGRPWHLAACPPHLPSSNHCHTFPLTQEMWQKDETQDPTLTLVGSDTSPTYISRPHSLCQWCCFHLKSNQETSVQ